MKGRKKNAAPKTIGKGFAVAMQDFTTHEKYHAIRYGRKFNADALKAIHALHNSMFLHSVPPDPVFDKQMFEEFRDEAWAIIARHYAADWIKHDGSFFRALADAMDYHMRIPDPAWTSVGGLILQSEERGLNMPTISEACRSLEGAGISVTRKTVERVFKFYNARPTPEKRGPKKGTKQKLGHRVRR